ncbi:hypothetical protein Acal02_02929 [Acinetobacter calcoaceticus]
MKRFFLIPFLLVTSLHVLAEQPMQPALKDYDHCNQTGTICSRSGIDYSIEDGKKITVVNTEFEANSDLLLNLDHFYRKKCMTEMGIGENESIPKSKFKQWGGCVVERLNNAIQYRNQENLDYLEQTKKIFQ